MLISQETALFWIKIWLHLITSPNHITWVQSCNKTERKKKAKSMMYK